MAEARIIDRKVFREGDLIFKKGDEGNQAYLLQAGTVEILTETMGGRLLGEIQAGSLFGEMALIDGKPRMATARAKEMCTVIIVSQQAFQEKLQKADPFIRGLLKIFVNNIRQMAEKR